MGCNSNSNINSNNYLYNEQAYWALELERISNNIVIFNEYYTLGRRINGEVNF